MRYRVGLLIILALSGCSRPRARKESDRDSPAFKVGAAAHEIAKHAEKTAAEAERELELSKRQLQESARKAKEGWQQKDREDREKSSPSH
jgi:hypothetical protein